MPYLKSELSKLIEITLKPGILQLYTQCSITNRGNSTQQWRMGSLSFMGSENCFIHLIFISNVGDISESIRITNKQEFLSLESRMRREQSKMHNENDVS